MTRRLVHWQAPPPNTRSIGVVLISRRVRPEASYRDAIAEFRKVRGHRCRGLQAQQLMLLPGSREWPTPGKRLYAFFKQRSSQAIPELAAAQPARQQERQGPNIEHFDRGGWGGGGVGGWVGVRPPSGATDPVRSPRHPVRHIPVLRGAGATARSAARRHTHCRRRWVYRCHGVGRNSLPPP